FNEANLNSENNIKKNSVIGGGIDLNQLILAASNTKTPIKTQNSNKIHISPPKMQPQTFILSANGQLVPILTSNQANSTSILNKPPNPKVRIPKNPSNFVLQPKPIPQPIV
ncbi:MAG: hypothetical protein ACK559_03605, partial [bacterium]